MTLAAEEPVTLHPDRVAVPIRFEMPEGVHVYWLNPGEAGMATEATLTLPDAWARRDHEPTLLRMPPPIRFTSGGVVGFGYEDEVTMLAEARMRKDVAEGAEGRATVTVRYLACDPDRCVPGRASFEVAVVAGQSGRGRTAAQKDALEPWTSMEAVEATRSEAGVWSFPLAGVPTGAEEVGYFALPREEAEPLGNHAALHVIDGAPEAEEDGDGGFRVTASVTPDPHRDKVRDPGRPWTAGLVGYTLDGERRGVLLLIGLEEDEQPPQPADPALP